MRNEVRNTNNAREADYACKMYRYTTSCKNGDWFRVAVLKLFWLRTPILLRHTWRTTTLVTVKFTAKY